MPIYEYECANCGHTMEAIQKISDKPLTECPSCHEQQLRKLVSAAAFQLKGTGWYVTDFKDKPKPADTARKAGESTAAKSGDDKVGKKEPETASADSPGKSADKKTPTSAD